MGHRMMAVAAGMAALVAAGAAAPAWALGVEDYIGSVSLTAAAYCPIGTMEAAGQSLSLRDHQAVYALIGSRYGGDDKTVFNLPDLRDKVPLDGMRWCFVVEGLWPTHD